MSFLSKWHKLRFWLLWPGLFVYFKASRRARVVIVSGNSILLIKGRSRIWFDTERWTIPGGGLRFLEKPAVGAARELQEELGITVDPADLKPLWQGKVGEYGLKYRAQYMLLRLPRSTPLQLQESEVAAAKWHMVSGLRSENLKAEAQRAVAILAGKS